MSIASISIVNADDQLIFIDNYIKNGDEHLFKFQTFTALQQISPQLQKKLFGQSQNDQYLGFLYTIYLPNNDYDVHAYVTPTQLKFVIFIKSGQEKFNLSQIFEKIYGLYRASNYNPFHQLKLNNLLLPMVQEFNGN